MKSKTPLAALALGSALVACTIAGVVKPGAVRASDHDDGENDIKGRNLNLTDLYVFREQDQNPAATANDLIFILNCNPRSVARQEYYFNTQATYTFKVNRVAAIDDAASPTGKTTPDVALNFRFGAPDVATNASGAAVNASTFQRQVITVTATRDGQSLTGSTTGLTTPLSGAATPTNTAISIGGQTLTVFAGLREDPFFFDVEQFFRVRASAARRLGGSTEAQVTFRTPGVDFTTGYNVLSLVVRVPRAFLQGSSSTATTFDVWETISVPNPIETKSLRQS